MTWQPGRSVLSIQDELDWRAWKKDSKLKQQRERRQRYRRIDYYPSDDAAEIIDANVRRRAGHDLSSAINRIVAEWAATAALPE